MPITGLSPNIPARELAHAFGWQDADLKAKEISRGGTNLSTARSFLSGESATVFSSVQHRNGYDPIDTAALYGYHIASDWGIVADPQRGLTLYNSRWLLDGRWYTHPTIPWNEISANQGILESLTPEGVAAGEPSRIASDHQAPTAFLLSVDDALVERLDAWRDQALKFARSASRVDDQLQTVYAQLFVLRTIEDRKLDPLVPFASSVLNKSGGISWRKWTTLIRNARDRIGSELFEDDVGKAIPEHVLAGVISDLYSPHRVPDARAKYDFSWIDSDVLGLAYEKYLATVLQPTPPPAQTDLFNSPARGVERISVRKSSGAYYTPKYITTYLASRTVDEYFLKSESKAPPYVIDFACGSGSFLVAAVDRVLKHLNEREPGRHWARELIESRHIVGIDIDRKAVTAARLQLWQRLLEEPGALPLPTLGDVIAVGDGLRRDTWGDLNRPYDIVLGNPPFLSTDMVADRESLEARFVTAKGRYDFSSLFVEQGIGILAPAGHLGMVTPNRLYRNQSGAALRGHITQEMSILTIVDFGSTRPFDANAYVGCLVAQKRDRNTPAPAQVRVIQLHSLEIEFLASVLLRAESGQEPNSQVLRTFLARQPHGTAPWLLLSDEDQRSRVVLEDASIRLDALAHIAQGIRTGANDFFIFQVNSDDGVRLCEVTNGVGQRVIMERDLLEPVVYGSEVQRSTIVIPQNRLLYPYRKNVPLSEGEFERLYPRAWEYVLSNRDFLGARSSLQKSRGKFFELVWPRDEEWLRRPKLLIRDLAPRIAFAIDPSGETFLVGGTAVVPREADLLLPLMGYLNSRAIDGMVKQTTPSFRGDFQKFEPQHIQSIPVLNRILEDGTFAQQLGELAALMIREGNNTPASSDADNAIDQLVSDALAEQGLRFDF